MERIKKTVEKEDILNLNPRKFDRLMDYVDFGDEDEDVRRRAGIVVDGTYNDEVVQRDTLNKEK